MPAVLLAGSAALRLPTPVHSVLAHSFPLPGGEVLCRECLRQLLVLRQLLQQRVLRSCPPLLLLRLPLSALAAVAWRSTRHEERRTAATALSRGGASAAGERVTIQPQVLGEYSPRRVGAGGGRGRICSGRGPGYATAVLHAVCTYGQMDAVDVLERPPFVPPNHGVW